MLVKEMSKKKLNLKFDRKINSRNETTTDDLLLVRNAVLKYNILCLVIIILQIFIVE